VLYDTRVPVAAISAKSDSVSAPVSSRVHSETNIQVAGIDESDTVRTNGSHIYTFQSAQNSIIILDAKNLNKLKTVKLPENYTNVGFYITKNSLIVTATKSQVYSPYWYGWYDNTAKSIIAIYDITDTANIKLMRHIQIDGILSESRLDDTGYMTLVTSNSYTVPPLYGFFSKE
jgi:inhibitor of cysteine peptidase